MRHSQAVMLSVRPLEFSVWVDCGRRPELTPWMFAQAGVAKLRLHAQIAETAACAWCWQGLCGARTALMFARGIQRAVMSDFGSGSKCDVTVTLCSPLYFRFAPKPDADRSLERINT